MSSPDRKTDPKSIVTEYAEEVFNHGNLAAVDKYIAPDYLRHDPGVPFEIRGPEGIRQLVGGYRVAFPDFHLDLVAITTSGDLVGTHWRASGTHGGDFMGMPPTGKSFTVEALETFRLADGKIAEQWIVVDTESLMTQLGVGG
jgi:steroid delta-isomerase-like uncharacterized protein